MEVLSLVIYIIVALIIMFFIGFGVYIVYDYINMKKELEANLSQSNDDINYNFKTSAKSLKYLYNEVEDNDKDISKNTARINELSTYTSNTSNVFATNFNAHVLENNSTFNSFNDNLNRYFKFNDGNKNIADNTAPNNKIFNYVFGTSIPNMQLISQTTAINGITINSDINKELKICSAISPNTCIKTNIDREGNFTVSSEGSSNIIFRNNDNTSTLASFDTYNKTIYLGGNNPTNSAMYIKDNDVYIKNLKLISSTDDNKHNSLSYNSFARMPIYTIFTRVDSPKTTAPISTVVKASITVHFDMTYSINNNTKLVVSNINMAEIDPLITPAAITLNFKNTDIENSSQASKVSYDSNGIFRFSDLSEIPAGYKLTFEVSVTIPNKNSNNTISYATSSYLQ